MSRLLALLTWLAFPAYVWQGLSVRRRSQRMLPAAGPVRHRLDGEGEPLALLVLGDSSAASVGIGHSENGLAAQLSRRINRLTGRPVTWRAAGFNSATAGQILHHVLPNLAPEPWTHIVLSVGTNDTKNFHTVSRFRKEFGGLLYALRAKWPEARLVWSPVVEMTRVPVLPPLLARILETRAGLMNATGARLCAERGAVAAPRLPILDPVAGFAGDGFHAECGDRDLPDVPAPLQTRKTERADEMSRHHQQNQNREELRHRRAYRSRRCKPAMNHWPNGRNPVSLARRTSDKGTGTGGRTAG